MLDKCNCTCQNIFNKTITINVNGVERGNIMDFLNNETSFWTIFTLTCTSVGIALVTAAMALLILTASLFAEWRKSYKNQMLIQLMLARFFYSSVRYFNNYLHFSDLCLLTDPLVLLNILVYMYSEMVLVAWMFMFSRQIYICLVKVFATDINIWIVSVSVWIVPAAMSILLQILFYMGLGASRTFFIVYLALIKWPVLLANAVFLVLALKSVLINNMNSDNNARIIVVMIVLIFMFSINQIVVDIVKVIFVHAVEESRIITTALFVCDILSVYHCSFSIVFWVLGNANTRKLWRFRDRDMRGKTRLSIT